MSEDMRKMIDRVKNFKQFVNESVETLENRLKIKLLSIGGNDVKLGLDSEEEQNRMLNDGRIYDEKVNFVISCKNATYETYN
jgi:hypothetical protein